MMGYFDEDWTKVKYFTKKEFLCKCGKCERDTGVSFTLVRIIDMMREDMERAVMPEDMLLISTVTQVDIGLKWLSMP